MPQHIEYTLDIVLFATETAQLRHITSGQHRLLIIHTQYCIVIGSFYISMELLAKILVDMTGIYFVEESVEMTLECGILITARLTLCTALAAE